MIVVKLIGGLGNQMFQYATARTMADNHDARLKLDISGFERYRLRRYELGDFNIRAEIAGPDDMTFFRVSLRRCSIWQCLKRRSFSLSPKPVFRERAFAYNEELSDIKPPVYLEGYWQSERYFLLNSKAIREDFTLRCDLDGANREMLTHIESVNAVSLHVRRGDYVDDPNTNEFHGICSLEYYRAAIECVADRVEKPHFVVFSDDQEWAGRNISFDYPATFVTLNSKDRGVLDMALMQRCRHHIIANSSFSWWGAWLNPSASKLVIAPKRWFNNVSHDTRDLIPPSWIVL